MRFLLRSRARRRVFGSSRAACLGRSVLERSAAVRGASCAYAQRARTCLPRLSGKYLAALNFPIDTLLSAPRRLQKHRQHQRDENHEENGGQQDRDCQSRATYISAFTAKPPGMRNRRLCLSAPNNTARGAEAASSGLSNRRATRGTRFVPEPRQGGDAPGPRVQSLHPRRIAP